ncbi:sodium channel protein Nach-like isoform X2 [Nilaparvata lugens]|uniref:sodium channel protein Nach-like isoform X2 n=1 Tax=Nilaparvata lugens TaxID=108931 RepID=UPI00193CC83D|nr:sodium channel protein Nach-like isoform X2 [Nilaparvata lugens]
MQEFSRHTSIPWFKCFFDPRFSYIERILISAILTIAFVYASSLVYAVCNNVLSYPLVTNIESLQYPAWEQPFPTIFICPLNRISKDGITKQVDKWILPKNISKREMMLKLRSIPNGAYRMTKIDYPEIIEETMAMNNVSMRRLFEEITLPCEEMIGLCKWKSKDIDCRDLFERVIQQDGHCCAFNYIHPKQEVKKRNIKNMEKMSGSGFATGLKMSLFINYSDAFSSFSSSLGYIIYAGDPGSYTDGRSLGRILRRRSANFFSFTSTRIERSENIMRLPVEYRACSGPEHQLSAFRKYTMSNCKTECIMRLCLKNCQCLPIIYPKYSGAINYISSGTNLTLYTDNKLEIENARPCGCHPSCSIHHSFDVAVSSSPINMDILAKDLKTNISLDIAKEKYKTMEYFCDVYVYSQGNMLTKIITDIKYDVTELLGFIGTIASFTMGWSIICLIEIVHFLIQLALKYFIIKIENAREVETIAVQ